MTIERQSRVLDDCMSDDTCAGMRRSLRVLILTAAIGGGHEAAAAALKAELERAGHVAIMTDGLRPLSPLLDWMMRDTYTVQLDRAPSSLDLVFVAFTNRPIAALVRRAVGGLFGGRLLRLIMAHRADLVVSAFPLLSAALGELRRSGRLRVPVVVLASDYGVHALWTAPCIDLHLVPCCRSAQVAERAGGRALPVRLPVAPAFRDPPNRAEARACLGLPPDGFLALITGGSWGVGNLEGAARIALEAGAHAVIATGGNEPLRAMLLCRFADEPRVHVLGWVEQMPALLRAADCLIQNAGGMTCVEAVEVRLPIIFFEPIPGHGVFNARVMEEASAALWPRNADALRCLLVGAVTGRAPLPPPHRDPGLPNACATIERLMERRNDIKMRG